MYNELGSIDATNSHFPNNYSYQIHLDDWTPYFTSKDKEGLEDVDHTHTYM